MFRVVLSLVALASLGVLCPTDVFAEGREFDAQRYDLQVKVDTRWAGCRLGGYYPIRLRLTNTGPARNITVRLSPPSRHAARVDRTIGLAQNATARLSLPIPIVGPGNYGELSLWDDGRRLAGMEWNISLPDPSWNEAARPAFLIVSPKVVDMSSLEAAVQATFSPAPGSTSYGYGRTTATANDHVILPKEQLPDAWIDYSGLDAVFIPLATLTELPQATRTAILAWVETGGTLVVTSAGGPAAKSEPLRKALSLDQRAAAFQKWSGADADVQIVDLHERANATSPPGTTVEGAPDTGEKEKLADTVWPHASETFESLRLLQGTVFAFPQNPFPGGVRDWRWFLHAQPESGWLWHQRHGVSARVGHPEFLHHEIPNLRSVPASAFVILISAFALMIGPVNYFVLWRKKRLWMLVVTIPAIAFLTSAALFGYSTVAHGFGVRSRTRSLTVIDQQNRTAVSTARISLFAGLSPSRGMSFSPETAVIPVWADDPQEVGGVDWTQSQTLDSSWLRSRTRTQFVTVRHRPERGRLVVGEATGGKLPVENGFSWGLELLVVTDAAGNRFVGSDLDAGAGTQLVAVTNPKTQLDPFTDALLRHPLKLPEGAGEISPPMTSPRYGRPYYPGWNMEGSGRNATFRTARLEALIASWATLEPARFPPAEPKSYIAILRDNPGIEMGVESVRETAPLHVLQGHY